MRELNETSPVDSLFKRSATYKISAGPPKVAPNHGTRVVAFESEAPHDVDDETVDERWRPASFGRGCPERCALKENSVSGR